MVKKKKKSTFLKVRWWWWWWLRVVLLLAYETKHPKNVEHVQAHSLGTVDKHRP